MRFSCSDYVSVFKALSDETRLRIVIKLCQKEMCAGSPAEGFCHYTAHPFLSYPHSHRLRSGPGPTGGKLDLLQHQSPSGRYGALFPGGRRSGTVNFPFYKVKTSPVPLRGRRGFLILLFRAGSGELVQTGDPGSPGVPPPEGCGSPAGRCGPPASGPHRRGLLPGWLRPVP